MLKVNVGLSRKLSRDFNSTGFSLHLEGEICAGPHEPDLLIERIQEYYDLAEEALNRQIERYESVSAIGSRDEPTPSPTHSTVPTAPSYPPAGGNSHESPSQPASPTQTKHNSHGPTVSGEAATNKQVQYLLNLGKRQGLSSPQLEGRIESILGRRIGVYDLSKKDAGTVIDALGHSPASASSGNGGTRSHR